MRLTFALALILFSITSCFPYGAQEPVSLPGEWDFSEPEIIQPVTVSNPPALDNSMTNPDQWDQEMKELVALMLQKYGDLSPKEWGERVTGVITYINTQERVIALTFDACGATGLSAGYDQELINFLVKESIPATLFLSGQWLEANWSIAVELSQNPLFSIQNHGYRHQPLSVRGKSIYGIKGTADIGEVVAEIWFNDQLIQQLTGRLPIYYRSGTAYYDEVAVMIARDMGKEVINFNVLGDAGATYSKIQIQNALFKAKPGSIILYHMNRPESEIASALIEALPRLRSQGFRFVKLEEYHGQLK